MVTSKKGKETPTEQLLRMIEGSPAPGGPMTPAAAPSLQRLLEIVQDAASRLRQRLLPSRRETDTLLWNLRVVQRALWVALAALGAAAYVAAIRWLWPAAFAQFVGVVQRMVSR